MNKIWNLSPYFKRPYNWLFKASWWWWEWWKPWANTIAYFPLEKNSNEASWKIATATDNSVNYSMIWWVKCANATSSTWYIGITTSIFDDSSVWTEQTISFWMYLNALPWWTSNRVFEFERKDRYSFYFLARSNNVYRYEWNDAWSTIDVNISNDDIWKWNYFTLVNSASWKYIYKNWVQIWTWTWVSRPRWNRVVEGEQANNILNSRSVNGGLNWWLRELIFENKVRTAQEIQDYYNNTKANYWWWLPSAYQEVEYIQSSGTQYFIVWTSFKTSYKSVIDLEMDVIWWDYIPLWVHNDAWKRYGIDAYGGKFTVISWWGSWTNTATEDTNRHLITIDKTTATVDGTDYSILYSDYTYNKWVWVFGYHNTQTNGVNYESSNKLYKLDIYDENWTQIYDLVPCYRKSDSVIGMYDIINDVFYTNEWTGTFTKWNDVN